MTGLRATLAVENPQNCPVSALAEESGTKIDGIRWSHRTDGDVTEEFQSAEPVDATEVFEGTDSTRYRIERDGEGTCVCEIVEQAVCPVSDVTVTESGELHMTVHLPSTDELAEIIGTLREAGIGVELKCLLRDVDDENTDPVLVDRGRLTTRQREVLETAVRMGYFEYPRKASASEVASELGIVTSTFAEHLAAAQARLLDSVFEGSEATA